MRDAPTTAHRARPCDSDIDPRRLSACQRDAASGHYAQATAGYIQWLAPRLDQVRAQMNAIHGRHREQAAHKGLHRRTPGIVADLFIGWQRFFDFAHDAEALTRREADVCRARVWNALIEVVQCESEHQREANPVDRFLGLLRSAISTGHAHLAPSRGRCRRSRSGEKSRARLRGSDWPVRNSCGTLVPPAARKLTKAIFPTKADRVL
jgi:hypothetical protein